MKSYRRLSPDGILTLLVALYAAAVAGCWVLGGPLAWPLNLLSPMVDDGFYYLKIAQHLAQGAGSTFDGLHFTNGYHPLWLLCLTVFFWLTPNAESVLIWRLLFECLTLAISAAFVYRTARLLAGRIAATLAALVWVEFAYRWALSGMEFHLHALGLTALGYVYARWFVARLPTSRAPYFLLGVLASLTFLARLEAILLAGCLGMWLWLRRAPTHRLTLFALPIGLTTITYAGLNLMWFGHIGPVSGAVKRAWSEFYLLQDPLYQNFGWLAAKANNLLWPLRYFRRWFSVYVALGTVGALIGAIGSRSVQRALGPFVAFSILQWLGYILVYHTGLSYPPWYYAAPPWLTALLGAWLVDKSWKPFNSGPTRWVGATLLVFIGVSVSAYTFWTMDRRHATYQSDLAHEPLYAAALWAGERLPPNAMVGAWSAGAVSYFFAGRVINLDGLVNDWAFYQTDQYQLCDYLSANRVTYLVDVFDFPQPFEFAEAQGFATCAGQWEQIWLGPALPNTTSHAAVYQWRPTVP